jgi:inward rectifier potassium channel
LGSPQADILNRDYFFLQTGSRQAQIYSPRLCGPAKNRRYFRTASHHALPQRHWNDCRTACNLHPETLTELRILSLHNFTSYNFLFMALRKRINLRLKDNNDTGFGSNAGNYGGRFVNKDGSFNVKKEGLAFWDRFSIFHTMLDLPIWKFITIIVLVFIVINLFFTAAFYVVGISEFTGMITTNSWYIFRELYFFSTETFSTVGYGRVNPVGGLANFVAAADALSGSLFFALVTGLMYGRFSKPKAHIRFSRHALISPYKDISGLMFRFVTTKDRHTLTDVEVRVNLSLLVQENGVGVYKFYSLPLERTRVDNLPMNFTVVHPVNDESPILGLSYEDMKLADLELYVYVKGYDDAYSNQVLQRTSYTFEEIIFDAKFVQMYRESEDGLTTIVELHKLNEYKEAKALT